MSMTRIEFLRRYQILRGEHSDGVPSGVEIAALVEEAGFEWDPEPTPEPTGDLSLVRVIDAEGRTWRPILGGWSRIGSLTAEHWSEIPQPVTVLRPEGSAS